VSQRASSRRGLINSILVSCCEEFVVVVVVVVFILDINLPPAFAVCGLAFVHPTSHSPPYVVSTPFLMSSCPLNVLVFPMTSLFHELER
jgi:hypothetical protein